MKKTIVYSLLSIFTFNLSSNCCDVDKNTFCFSQIGAATAEKETIENDIFTSTAVENDLSFLILDKYDYSSKTRNSFYISYDKSGSLDFPAKYNNKGVSDWTIYQKYENKKSSHSENRIIVDGSDLDMLPASSIGRLFIGSNYSGSCFLLSNGYVLTAAHCVFMDDAYFSNLRIGFGKTSSGFKTYTNVVESYIPLNWRLSSPSVDTNNTPEQEEWDWALLKVDNQSLASTYGALSLASNISWNASTYTAVGYPKVKNYNLCQSLGLDIAAETEYTVDVYSYVSGGMSGGPLIEFCYEWDDRIQAEYKWSRIVGIISNSDEYTGIRKIDNGIISLLEDL